MNDFEFCRVVIDLNAKILEECQLNNCTLNDDINMETVDKEEKGDNDQSNELQP